MRASAARVGAVIRKELAEFRRNRLIVGTAAVLPVIFLILPTVSILTVKASALSAGVDKGIDRSLSFPLIAPVFVPSMMSAFAVVGEREQGTLEPLLTTPVGRAELLIGKAAAIFIPAAALGYLIFGVFVAITEPAAAPAVAAALAGGLLAADCAACLVVARLFDRERLITRTRPSRGIPAPAAPQDNRPPADVGSHQ